MARSNPVTEHRLAGSNFIPDEHHRLRLYDGAHDGAERVSDLQGFDPTARNVIILPGTRVTHEVPQFIINAKFITAYRNMVKDALGRKGIDDANIYCGVYGHNDEQLISDHYSYPLREGTHIGASVFTTPASGTDVRDFVQNILLPVAGISESTKPSPETVAEHLSRLTLVAHSYGGTFGAEIDREFQRVLVEEHAYTPKEATRIASEIVEVEIAPVRDMGQDVKGFRRIGFISQADRSNHSFMQRVAQDHMDDAHIAPDTDLNKTVEHYYARSGYRFAPDERKPTAETMLEEPVEQGGYSQLVRADMPFAIHWQSNSGKPRFMDQRQLDGEHGMLEGAICSARGTTEAIGLNGEVLIRHGLVPAHDHRMYSQPANENKPLVDAFDTVLANTVERAVQSPQADPAKTVAKLAQSAFTPPSRVQGVEHIERTRPSPASGIQQ